MPKVVFVNEHREVEVEPGRLLSDVADELGIAVCREEFAGTGLGDYTVWVKGDRGCVSDPTWYERFIKRVKGQRRMANRTKVLGDCEVWTQGGLGSRQAQPRPIHPAARAGEDGSARFDHENNAAGTAWNPFGHPKAVGQGKREAPKFEPKKKKEPKAKGTVPAGTPRTPGVEAEPEAEEADDADEAEADE